MRLLAQGMCMANVAAVVLYTFATFACLPCVLPCQKQKALVYCCVYCCVCCCVYCCVLQVCHSKVEELVLPEEGRVDVLVSEPMGTLLVNERMLETYLHARDHFLKPGGQMFPVGAWHVHLRKLSIECTAHWEWHSSACKPAAFRHCVPDIAGSTQVYTRLWMSLQRKRRTSTTAFSGVDVLGRLELRRGACC